MRRLKSYFMPCMNWIDNYVFIYFVLENLEKIMYFRFNFYACPVHLLFGFVHLTHKNIIACAFCSLNFAKANTWLLIYYYQQMWDDARLKWDPAAYNGVKTIVLHPDQVWLPDIELYNRWEWPAVQSKNAVCAFTKHSRYFHLACNFTSIMLKCCIYTCVI